MNNPKGRREAFDDALIIVNNPVPTKNVIEMPPYPNELVGTFELGDIDELNVLSIEKGLGDIDDPDFGGHLGMLMSNNEK